MKICQDIPRNVLVLMGISVLQPTCRCSCLTRGLLYRFSVVLSVEAFLSQTVAHLQLKQVVSYLTLRGILRERDVLTDRRVSIAKKYACAPTLLNTICTLVGGHRTCVQEDLSCTCACLRTILGNCESCTFYSDNFALENSWMLATVVRTSRVCVRAREKES